LRQGERVDKAEEESLPTCRCAILLSGRTKYKYKEDKEDGKVQKFGSNGNRDGRLVVDARIWQDAGHGSLT
jgi:hypothetical protein